MTQHPTCNCPDCRAANQRERKITFILLPILAAGIYLLWLEVSKQ